MTGIDAAQEGRDATGEQRLLRYLRRRAEDSGEFYFKSKHIAEDVGLSPSQIGTLLGRFQETVTTLEIEQWAYTNATTWRITSRADR